MAQLTLDFEPGIAQRYLSLRDCCSTRIYHYGLGKAALDLDKSPGNLSVELSGDKDRHFSVEALERYMEKSKDLEPIRYLVARFMGEQTDHDAEVMRRVEGMLAEVTSLMGQVKGKGTGKRR